MSTTTIPIRAAHIRTSTVIGGLFAGIALAAAVWVAAADLFDRSTDALRPEHVPVVSDAGWFTPAERAAGYAGLAASTSGIAGWGGTPPPTATQSLGGTRTDMAQALLGSSTFSPSQMAAIAAALQATGLPLTIPGS